MSTLVRVRKLLTSNITVIESAYFPLNRALSLSSLVAHEDVGDGDLEAEVAVPAAVELDVADSLVEVEEAQHPLGRHHVLLVHHHHEVAAADVGEVVLPPLLVLLWG